MRFNNSLRRSSIAIVLACCGSASALAQDLNLDGKKIALAVRAFALSKDAGLLKGVRALDVIRPDMVALQLDWGAVGGWKTDDKSISQGPYAVADDPSFYSIQCPTDPNYQRPARPLSVGRVTQDGHNARGGEWALQANIHKLHDVHLTLPHPLKTGHRYTIAALPQHPIGDMRYAMTLDYSDADTPSKAIKINQVGYSALAKRRYAYLGWWQGVKLGAVKYDDFAGKPFFVCDASTDGKVLDGTIKLRRRGDELSGEDIHEMDLSPLQVGRYYIRIPGLARSLTFNVGGQPAMDLYYHTMRAFFHQRCGQELGPPYTWVQRPACHTRIAQNGWIADNRQEPKPPANEPVREFRGGYHDAADFDVFTYHLSATRRILEVYEMMPEAFRDGDLDLQESGNKIPDILDEAEWNITGHMTAQQPDGGVPLGRINECDSLSQNFVVEKGKAREKGLPFPPFGLIPPTRSSSSMFAAAAAQFSSAIRPFDKQKADRYLDAARRAFEFDVKNKPSDVVKAWNEDPKQNVKLDAEKVANWDKAHPTMLAVAAAQLLRATGDRSYEKYVSNSRRSFLEPYLLDQRIGSYLANPSEKTDEKLRHEMRQRLLETADELVRRTEEGGYRMSNGQLTLVGWGAAQGINTIGTPIWAHQLTGDQKYLDAICLNADFHLGCNPIGKVFLTGMGYNPPRRPEISGYLYERHAEDYRGGQVKGIGIYGFGPPLKHDGGEKWPPWRSWRDVWDDFAEIYSEFTVHQTLGPSAMTYSYLYALEKKCGTLPASVKRPDPLVVGVDATRPQAD